MSKLAAVLILGLCLATVLAPATAADAQTLGLEGRVTNGSFEPIPGLTVFLVHPAEGRSRPRITDARGRFVFQGVPYVDDEYYLEVYWGDELMYRSAVVVHEYVRWPDVVLD